jgi:Tol biopolymer transport system component
VKLAARIAATFNRSGVARTDVAAAVPVASTGAEGSGARPTKLIAVLALAVAALLALGASSALAAAPTLTVDPTPTAAYTTAQVSGTVDPADNDLYYWFQYNHDPDTEEWSNPPNIFAHTLAANSGPTNVSEAITGLKPGTEYKVRLVAFRTDESEIWVSEAPYAAFTTEPVTAPTAGLDAITTFTGSTAHFSGTVNPDAPAGPLTPAAEVVYETQWSFTCEPECPGLSGGSVAATEAGKAVSVDATGLEPNTPYEVTLHAANAGGSVTDTKSFTTSEIPPGVNVGPGSSAGDGGFHLEGTVNPHNSAITGCVFEYGPTASYGQIAPCEPTPTTGSQGVFVTVLLPALTVNGEYHFRLTATNGAGPTSTADATFVAHPPCPNEAIREEQRSTFLPECRAWEQVSAPFKEGFMAALNQYTDDGDRALYTSSGNIAENGMGAATYGNPYLTARSATGWITEPAAPSGPQYALLENFNSSLPFSADLRTGLFQMSRSDQGANALDFYLRDSEGAFDRIGPVFDPTTLPPSAPGGSPVANNVLTLATSPDLTRIAFSRGSQLFEYNSGASEAEPADVDNTGQPLEPLCSEGIGSGELIGPKSISDDGRVLAWTRSCGPPIGRELYARIGHTTLAVSASLCDRAPSDPAGPCVESEPGATYAGMAADGSVVYFISSNQLVDGDTDETPDLYACDIPPGEPAPTGAFNSCESLTEVTDASTNAEVEGAVSISEDGTHVYFVAHGVLAPNSGANGESAAAGANNLYLWQRDSAHPQGETTFLARLAPSDEELWTGQSVLEGQTTPSGRFLLLSAHTPLVKSGPQADTDGGAVDVYRYDSDTGEFARVSTDSSGAGGNQQNVNAEIRSRRSFTSSTPQYRSHPAISSDGQTIVFTTREPLSPFDRNESSDIYGWHDGNVALVSSGRASRDATASLQIPNPPAPVVTPDGKNIFFETQDPLVATDTDTITDVYDARVEGGFPALAGAPSCMGESFCRGQSAPSPAAASPSTTSSTGGNPAPAPRCAKGKVRKQGRCVRRTGKPHHKKRHHAKGAHGKRHGKGLTHGHKGAEK